MLEKLKESVKLTESAILQMSNLSPDDIPDEVDYLIT